MNLPLCWRPNPGTKATPPDPSTQGVHARLPVQQDHTHHTLAEPGTVWSASPGDLPHRRAAVGFGEDLRAGAGAPGLELLRHRRLAAGAGNLPSAAQGPQRVLESAAGPEDSHHRRRTRTCAGGLPHVPWPRGHRRHSLFTAMLCARGLRHAPGPAFLAGQLPGRRLFLLLGRLLLPGSRCLLHQGGRGDQHRRAGHRRAHRQRERHAGNVSTARLPPSRRICGPGPPMPGRAPAPRRRRRKSSGSGRPSSRKR